MIFKKHIPNSADGPSPEPIRFASRRDLIKYIYSEFENSISSPNFHRLSVTSEGKLMLEYDVGEVWYVAGLLTGTEKELAGLKLPRFRTPKSLKLDKDASGSGDFEITHNPQSKLWEIVDRKKGRKIGACLHKKNITQLIEGYLAGEDSAK